MKNNRKDTTCSSNSSSSNSSSSSSSSSGTRRPSPGTTMTILHFIWVRTVGGRGTPLTTVRLAMVPFTRRIFKPSEEVRLATYFAQNPKMKQKISNKRKPYKFKIGDHVQISHLRTVFTRAYDETYTGEVFKIHKRYHRGTLPIYRLQDMQQEDITGTFYQSELQKVDYDPNQPFIVDQILRTKGNGHNKQFLVKWKYYPKRFNSWIKAKDIL